MPLQPLAGFLGGPMVIYIRGVGSNFEVARPSKLCFTSVFFPNDLFGKEMLRSRSSTGIVTLNHILFTPTARYASALVTMIHVER